MNRFKTSEHVLLVAIRKNGHDYEWRVSLGDYKATMLWLLMHHDKHYPELTIDDVRGVCHEIEEMAETFERTIAG
jgi:hypothetical protein